MLTEDYLMRMISQALAVLMTALGLKKAGKYKEALQVFDQAVESLCGLNAHLVDQLNDEMLLDKLNFMGKLDGERAVVLADIYREKAEVYNSLGKPENSHSAAQRSLRLYLEASLASEASLSHELIHKIEGLRFRLAIPSLPIETCLALQDYLDRLLASSDDFLTDLGLSRVGLQEAFRSLENPDPK
jgi:tetratricopeptide (TPR) repeat protein